MCSFISVNKVGFLQTYDAGYINWSDQRMLNIGVSNSCSTAL